MSSDREKRLAAEASAALLENGLLVGLGTGPTVTFPLPAPAARPSTSPGVVEHGLFPASMVSDLIVARGDNVESRRLPQPPPRTVR